MKEKALVTTLQLAMINKIARNEYSQVNGAEPATLFDIGSIWANVVIETASDRGVFTSLQNKGLVQHNGHVNNEALVSLTPKGFEIYQLINQPQKEAKMAKKTATPAPQFAAPAAPVIDPKAAAKAAREAAKAAKAAAPAPAAPAAAPAAKVERLQQNGITRPAPASACGKVWELADACSNFYQRPVSMGELLDLTRNHAATGTAIALESWKGFTIVEATLRTQYNRWRQYNGLTGQTISNPARAAAKEARQAEKEAAKQAKQAEKETKKMPAAAAVQAVQAKAKGGKAGKAAAPVFATA